MLLFIIVSVILIAENKSDIVSFKAYVAEIKQDTEDKESTERILKKVVFCFMCKKQNPDIHISEKRYSALDDIIIDEASLNPELVKKIDQIQFSCQLAQIFIVDTTHTTQEELEDRLFLKSFLFLSAEDGRIREIELTKKDIKYVSAKK